MRIVIADDEANVRSGLLSVIAEVAPDAHVMGQARTVEEVVELVTTHEPDLVLLDVKMPGGTGFDAIERLDRIASLPLWIIVSSYAHFEYAKKALKLSAFDYLLKPVAVSEMRAAIDAARPEVSRIRSTRSDDEEHEDTHSAGHTARDVAVRAKELIERQCERDIGIGEIAEQVGVTAGYLSTVFRSRYNESPLQHLTRVRMNNAAELLSKGYTVAETAAFVGYHDTRHFSRRFSRHWGCTPTDFMRTGDTRAEQQQGDG